MIFTMIKAKYVYRPWDMAEWLEPPSDWPRSARANSAETGFATISAVGAGPGTYMVTVIY